MMASQVNIHLSCVFYLFKTTKKTYEKHMLRTYEVIHEKHANKNLMVIICFYRNFISEIRLWFSYNLEKMFS